MFCVQLREGQESLEHALALRRLAVKQPVFSGVADLYTGKALMFQGDWEEGVNYVRKGVAFQKSVGLIGSWSVGQAGRG